MKKNIKVTEEIVIEDMTEQELKEAVCQYVNSKHDLSIKPDNVEFDSSIGVKIKQVNTKEAGSPIKRDRNRKPMDESARKAAEAVSEAYEPQKQM